jgi:predicted DCC family thiol-disulfide oxidoreductase YuxK
VVSPMVKFFVQLSGQCKLCKRKVDVISRDDQEGLLFSRHFASDKQITFCDNSFGEFDRHAGRK